MQHYFFFNLLQMIPLHVVLKSNFRGKAIDFPHNCIIRIDISSYLWYLLALRFFIIKWRSFSLISNDFNRLFVLKLKTVTGSVLVFWTRVHCSAKCQLNSSAFLWKSNTSLLLIRRGGIFYILFLFKNLFIIAQYVFNALSGQSNSELILVI